MKLGCGCLAGLLLLGVPLVLLASAVWLATSALATVPLAVAPTTAADGVSAQQKIYDIAARAGRGDGRGASGQVVLSERELNAFLSRHLIKAADVPLAGVAVKLLGGGAAELAGQVPLRYVLAEAPFAPIGARLPDRWLDRPLSVRLRARVRVEARAASGRRRLRIEPERSWVGRLPLPVFVLRLGVDPGVLQLLTWEIPESVDAVTIEPGRAVVRIASRR